MADLEYSVDLESGRVGQLVVVGITESFAGKDNQQLRFFEEAHVAALNFGRIFFGTGSVVVRAKKRKI